MKSCCFCSILDFHAHYTCLLKWTAHKKSRDQARALPTVKSHSLNGRALEWGVEESGSHRKVSLDAMAGANGAPGGTSGSPELAKRQQRTFLKSAVSRQEPAEQKYVLDADGPEIARTPLTRAAGRQEMRKRG